MGALQYSVHPYAWTGQWSNNTLDLIDRAKRLGFDAIEIPLIDIDLVDPKAIKDRLSAAGLGVCTSTACSETEDPTAEDKATRTRAIEFLKRCVKAAADMGAAVCTGVTYSAIGRRLERMPTAEHWDHAAAALKQVARYARDLGVTLGIEPVNRYETFLINTCDQALRLIDMVDEPNLGIHPDAYHMNIEECDFYHATRSAAPHLFHYHLSESHRGTVGTGVVDWDGIYRALAEEKYTGSVGMEAFIEVSPSMAAATCIWRTLAEDTDQSLAEGLKYLKDLEAKHYHAADKRTPERN